MTELCCSARGRRGGGNRRNFKTCIPPQTNLHSKLSRPHAKPTIKKTFADLGRQLGFRVAASGIPDADQGWLYDLVWFVPQAPFTTRVTLTLESALVLLSHKATGR